MTTHVRTGVEAVDRELERREPFPDAETAEATANRLLATWRAMQPRAPDAYANMLRLRRRRK
jgi:hypothetical protein